MRDQHGLGSERANAASEGCEKEKAKRSQIDFAAYNESLRSLPIGVFDSGVGGLTVLETVLNYDGHHNERVRGADGVPDFQNERFIYLGDQANMPYGNYAAAGKADFCAS